MKSQIFSKIKYTRMLTTGNFGKNEALLLQKKIQNIFNIEN